MTKRKSLFLLLLVGTCLIASSCAQKSSEVVPDDIISLPDEESASYVVAISSSTDAIAPDRIKDGIIGTLQEHYGERITFNRKDTKDADLIITIGEESLSSVMETEKETPIVAAEIRNYKDLLGDRYLDPEKGSTGTNITGIDTAPNASAQLSLMIEATKDLECVGLLYSPDDSHAIAQNRKYESYLDEAGIPWKEYIIPSEEYREYLDASKQQKKRNRKRFEPVTSAIKANELYDPLHPAISANWKGGKDAAPGATESHETSLPKDAPSSKVIKYACKECSSLYIPSRSNIKYLYKSICRIASKRSVTTLGGDVISGKYSLVTLYVPESEIGAAIGEYAIDILDNQRDPAEMDILHAADLEAAKLYNEKTARSFGLEFPKSFKKYSDRFQ